MTATAGISIVMAAGKVLAADNADVKVSETIVPPAYVPPVNGGTIFDDDTIKAATLKKEELNVLTHKKSPFCIVCDAPVKIGFKVQDQRCSSRIQPTGISLTSRTVTDDIKLRVLR